MVSGATQGTPTRTRVCLESLASGPWATEREIRAPVGAARGAREGRSAAPAHLGVGLIQATLFPKALTRKI
jgi:hypothetical protein